MVYLDNAATTYPKPDVVYDIIDNSMRNLSFNAGRGAYKKAKEASKLLGELRGKIGNMAGVRGEGKVIFTPSATYALNQILQGLSLRPGQVLYVSPYEHNSVMRVAGALQEQGIILRILPLDKSLSIDLNYTKIMFEQEAPAAICMTQVSNVTGYILPILELCSLGKNYDAITIIDGAQGFGLVPFHMDSKLYDFYSFAGHKTLYGPFGLGGYVTNLPNHLGLSVFGGTGSDSLNTQMPAKGDSRYEVGSPDIVAAAGLNAAIDDLLWQISHKDILQHEKKLTRYAREQLADIPGVKLFPNKITEDYVGIVSFGIEEYRADEVGIILDQDYDIAVRTGYHCSPLVHQAIGSIDYGGTVRVSFSQFSTKEDVDALVKAVKEL